MEMKRLLLLTSFIITLFLFMTIIFIGSLLNNKREVVLDNQFSKMSKDFDNMQLLYMLSESYGNDMVCLAFESKLRELDSYIWKLGDKIDRYRIATEEFTKDEYYVEQKKIFNEGELYYFLSLKGMVTRCNLTKSNILFFYKNSKKCNKCDDESFVLRDIRNLDSGDDREIAIFSFDSDLKLPSLQLMETYYNIEEYPCIVVDEVKHCGMKSKDEVMKYVCSGNHSDKLKVCREYYGIESNNTI